jgi:hypothetical protein
MSEINTTFRTFALAVIFAVGLGFAFATLLFHQGPFWKPIGIAKLVDGATYTGDIQNGLLEGRGTLRWPEGGSYEGEFKDGLLHGEGEFTDIFGNRYVGQFVEGQFTGRGKIYSVDDGIYDGLTKSWHMQGEGEYRLGESIYRGTFVDDVLTGQGEYLEEGGLVYRGAFEGWMYQGEGELTLDNGDRYVGKFRYGEYHGVGTMYLAEAQDGITQYSGKWRNGRLIASPQSHLVENYKADLELALYREAALLEAELGRVPDGDPTQAEIYFLGIAGDGTERVFGREVTAFRDHFDSVNPLGARQINLINDRGTIGRRPMATLTSIGQAIATLGARMNLDQDLLVLYISSHGSKEHEISLKNRAISLGDLSAKSLSTMLKGSGIRWQVIFVSACYSGGFIEPLQTQSTLIMTAAASDKTSFGCSDEAEMTYFGRALLESLATSKTFEETFETLSANIASRESEEDLSRSNPQLHAGEEISEKLQTFPGFFEKTL